MTMHTGVVIIVPSQGHNVHDFGSVARQLKATLFPHATILRTTAPEDKTNTNVTFKTLGGHPFTWGTPGRVTRVIVISHGLYDGPNLAYMEGGMQPWSYEPGLGGDAFWSSVAASMADNGRIYLLGCFEGGELGMRGAYAALVAATTKRRVYGSTRFFAAGKSEAVLPIVNALEKGKVPPPMVKF